MSDFFERLATRSAGLPGSRPRVLPRLAHQFERVGTPEVEPEIAVAPSPRPTSPVPVVPPPGVVERHTETVHHQRESHHSTLIERQLTTVDSSVHRVRERLEIRQPPLLVPVPAPVPAAAAIQPPEPAGATPVTPQPAPAAAQPVRAWTAVAKAASASVPARRAAAPEPERVVHVSIGRVEVKAATPAARAPRPSGRPSPAVPLEKYLAREGS